MVSNNKSNTDLPKAAIEYIDAVIKKMRYRKKVRVEVRAELTAHFEDALRDCDSEDEKTKLTADMIVKFGEPKILAKLIRRGKNRCRPLWQKTLVRVFLGIYLLFLGLILYCVYISFAQPNIRVDYAAKMISVSRPVADEDLNAAALYQKAIDNYVEPPKIMHEIEPTDSEQMHTEEIKLLKAIDDKQWISDLTEDEVTLLRQWVVDNDEAIEYFMAGSQRPYCWWERKVEGWLMNVSLAELGPLKTMVKLICWGAKLKASEGEIEAGFNDLLKCYKAGEHFKGPQTLIHQLVGIAMQAIALNNSRMILSNANVDIERLRTFQEELENMQADGIYTINYKIERFVFSDFIQRVYTDNGKGGGRMIPRGGTIESDFVDDIGSVSVESLKKSLVSANRRDMTSEFEKVFKTAEKWAEMTPWQLQNSGEDLDMGLETWSRIKQARYWPVFILTPALQKLSEMSYRGRVDTEALVATIAILRYEKEKGEYPESLDSLVADGYLKRLPMDPFSDGPLVYRATDDGFTLYSAGLNMTDDGGEYGTNSKGKKKQWGENGDRVFWPVWKDEN